MFRYCFDVKPVTIEVPFNCHRIYPLKPPSEFIWNVDDGKIVINMKLVFFGDYFASEHLAYYVSLHHEIGRAHV